MRPTAPVSQRSVTSTMLRIIARDQECHTTHYLARETEKLVGRFLPDGYNTLSAIRSATAKSNEVSWQGLSTFGLKEWDTALKPQSMVARRGRTGDLIYTFLNQHGPADINDVEVRHKFQMAHWQRSQDPVPPSATLRILAGLHPQRD